MVTGDDEVAGAGNFAAGAHSRALDYRNHRYRQVFQCGIQGEGLDASSADLVFIHVLAFLEVGTGTEHGSIGAHQQHVNIGALVDFPDSQVQFKAQLSVQGVACLRAIEGQGGDVLRHREAGNCGQIGLSHFYTAPERCKALMSCEL
ncbi:hypothetical protein D3C81_1769980 [compost metagenome]